MRSESLCYHYFRQSYQPPWQSQLPDSGLRFDRLRQFLFGVLLKMIKWPTPLSLIKFEPFVKYNKYIVKGLEKVGKKTIFQQKKTKIVDFFDQNPHFLHSLIFKKILRELFEFVVCLWGFNYFHLQTKNNFDIFFLPALSLTLWPEIFTLKI